MKKKASTKWIALYGDVHARGTVLHYQPSELPLEAGVHERNAMMKSDLTFTNGSIEMRVRLTSPKTRVQIVLGNAQKQLYAGLNVGPAAYGISGWEPGPTGRGWVNPATTGNPETLPVGQDISVKFTVAGSSAALLVDGVEVVTTNVEFPPSQVAIYFGGPGKVTAEVLKVESHKRVAFIVMQFTEEFDALYDEVIRPTCEAFGYRAVRGDDVYNNGLIIEDISRLIKEASVVIADITPANPNVYYEVGYAHAIEKPTILMAESKLTKLPFDVAGFRTIFYTDSIGGKSKVEERLSEHLRALDSSRVL